MTRYIFRRVALSAVVMFGVTVVVFGLVHLAPGDPVLFMLPDGAPQADIDYMRKALGLDQPLWVQYWVFLTNALQGDLGKSLYFKQPALEIK
ncbi:MAG: ABC transporter permease, partial [Chloroflexota bacterium]